MNQHTQSNFSWYELEVWLLVLIVAGLYLVRLDALSIRGEESRRARIGLEMLESGDWVVPRQQGEPFLSRPPMQNWIIVGLGGILGGVDVWAIRLPSVIALLGVVLLIYGYSRTFLSRFAAFTAAAAFASMPQVMELGRLGETEMMFTLFVSGSLLVWHWGFSCGRSPWAAWTSAYFLVALGTLAKGPQAPAYFVAAVGLYLLLSRNWRYAVSWAHLAGIVTFLIVWSAWQVPFVMELGISGARAVYGQDVGFRFADTRWITIIKHIVEFPLEIFLGCLLPWSLLLLPYFDRDFRRHIGTARDHVTFLACAIGVTFPTVWLVPGGHTRYLMPIYPCFAPLIGLVVERCLAEQEGYSKPASMHWWQGPWQFWWRRWLVIMAVAMPLFGLGVIIAAAVDGGGAQFGQSLGFAIFYGVCTLMLSALTFCSRAAESFSRRLLGPAAVALFMGLTFVGVFTNSLLHRSESTAAAVAEVKKSLPTDANLVSLGYVHHLFAYYYGDPIALIKIPEKGDICAPESEYFCFENRRLDASRLNFPYEVVAEVSCARFRDKPSDDWVTVARRVTTGTNKDAKPARP